MDKDAGKDLIDQLKSYNYIHFNWDIDPEEKENSEEKKHGYLTVAESEDLEGGIFGMKYCIYILMSLDNQIEDKYFSKFSSDYDYKYLISLESREDLENVCDVYFDRMPRIKNQDALNLIKTNMILEQNHLYSRPFKWKNNFRLFAGLHYDISEVENMITFNRFISLAPLRQATAFWNEPTVPMISAFRTIYSGSQFMFTLFNNLHIKGEEGNITYPMILAVNYPKSDRERDNGKFPNDMPLDCKAALDEMKLNLLMEEEVLDIEKKHGESMEWIIQLLNLEQRKNENEMESFDGI